MVTLFANMFKVSYYEHVMGSLKQFTDIVEVAERIKQRVRSGRISMPTEKRGFKGKRNEVDHVKGGYRGRKNQLQNYHIPYQIANINSLFPIRKPKPLKL